jgi:hypothetical protein
MSLYADANYEITVMGIFAVIGVAVKTLLGQSTSADGMTGPANAVIWGYGLVAASLFCVMFAQYALSNKTDLTSRIGSTTDARSFVSGIAKQVMPVTVILVVLAWTVGLNLYFAKQINKGDVTPSYNSLSRTSSFLVLFQLALAFKIAVDKLNPARPDKARTFDVELGALSYLLALMNIIILGIMNINLVFFSTDG